MIYLVRHGQSTSNAGEVTKCTAETCLSEKGQQQAKDLAHKIDKKPDLIIISPYIRTRQTVQPLIDKFPDVPVETWDVQEFTFLGHNSYNNTTQEVRFKWKDEYLKKNDPDYIKEDGAESFNQFMQRVDAFLEKAKTFDKNKLVYVFSHDRFMMAVKMRQAGITASIENLFSIETTKNTEILEV